ncbi:guanine deaminase [Sodiomyces alkalinus F11]|uniref:Probable guanine deaminase n=1 Tax=Sodiomyces alkalinus (strain CBS 110278 / VKM F-3762 / F11) TaxID=1314773 RepID=A0A3N2Q621_SODAK|nr:guanine deaminase [Sodiomyces alkalinus F11]ROT42229.1 guanine deaminase [Sodiomyces alkalinus F11]
MGSPLVFRGAMIHSLDLTHLEILENATLIISPDGRITAFQKSSAPGTPDLPLPAGAKVHHLPPGDFLIPGFVDTHNHAPQWPMRGLGQGLHILDWLEQVTFPVEARFSDPSYARKTYEQSVGDFLRHGITTASYYSSRHAESTRILADICHAKGQRAFVGKCNMDRNAPEYIREQGAADSLRETEECVRYIRSLSGHGGGGGAETGDEQALVKPIVTPRFAISCTPELLTGLGEMLKRDDTLAMQTHFNEAEQEIEATRALFPAYESEADLYDAFGLLGRRSVLAHCTIMTDYDKERLAALRCGVAHCPIANMTVGGGFMVAPVRDFLRRGIKVGLGTDSGGGWASQMLAVMRLAMIASNARVVLDRGRGDDASSLSLEEVFYLATMGGAGVLCLEDQIGNFEVGKQFDAVWVTTTTTDTALRSAMTPREEGDSLKTTFEKFVMTGDDRNMAHVYVRGRRVAGAGD